MEKVVPQIEMNKEQVVSILNFIDATQPEEVKNDIFCQLGFECFLHSHSKEWCESFQGNIQRLLDHVNVDGKSPYWEKLEFNEDKSILFLTGRPVNRCVCAFGNLKTPPTSLCNFCCKTFQENLFGTLFQRRVVVEITESSILGGTRCSTAIHLA